MKNFQGKRMVREDELQYLQELKSAHSDPSAEWGGGGSSYTAGTGITIESETISVDSTVAFKSDIPSFTEGEGITIDASDVISVDSTVAFKTDIPTSTSDLINNSGFITSDDLSVKKIGWFPDEGNTWNDVINELMVSGGKTADQALQTVLDMIPTLPTHNNESGVFLNRGEMFIINGYVKFANSDSPWGYDVLCTNESNRGSVSVVNNRSVTAIWCDGAKYRLLGTRLADTTFIEIGTNQYWQPSAAQGLTNPLKLYRAEGNQIDNLLITAGGITGSPLGINCSLSLQARVDRTLDPKSSSLQALPAAADGKYFLNAAFDSATPAKATYTWVKDDTPADPSADGSYYLQTDVSSGVVTKSYVPASGGSSKYLHKVKIYLNTNGTTLYFEDVFSSSSSTPYTSVDTFLTDRGYTVSSNSDQPTKRLETYATSTITALAYRTDQNSIAVSSVTVSGSGTQTCAQWAVESNTPAIVDEVM